MRTAVGSALMIGAISGSIGPAQADSSLMECAEFTLKTGDAVRTIVELKRDRILRVCNVSGAGDIEFVVDSLATLTRTLSPGNCADIEGTSATVALSESRTGNASGGTGAIQAKGRYCLPR